MSADQSRMTIRDALEAAAYALDHHDERKVGAATSSEELAAILIAAFLRSLHSPTATVAMRDIIDLAAAVETEADRAR